MKTLLMAVRNLMRNRRRSIATLLAISLGSIAVLLFGGYSKNIKYSMQTAYVQSDGHLQVQHRDFFLYGSGNPTAYGIGDYARVVDAIRNDAQLRDLVTMVTPMLQFGGLAGNYAAGVSRTVIGIGLVAPEYGVMRNWNDYDLPRVRPAFALDGTSPDAAIAGIGLARVLQLCEVLKLGGCRAAAQLPGPAKGDATDKSLPDDIAALSQLEGTTNVKAAAVDPAKQRRIDLLTASARGAPNVASLEVVRAESQGFKELDEVYLQLHLAQTQRLVYGSDAPRVTAVMVQLRHTRDMGLAAARIRSLLPSLEAGQPLAVLDFETLNPFYVQTIQLFDTIFAFMFILIGGIVLFTVGNTMNTAVVERTVEIGTLRAIGLRQSGIRNLFVVEGLTLGLVGVLLGTLAALIVASGVNLSGLTWVPPGTSGPVPLTLRVWGENTMILGTAAGLVVITTVSAWWPARRAARLDIVEALRHY